MNTYLPDSADLETFSNLISKYLKQSPYNNYDAFIKQAMLSCFELPINLRNKLVDFKLFKQNGYLLISGLPCDHNLMDTPQNHIDVLNKKQTFMSEFWLSVIGSYLGDPFGYLQESEGFLFHNIRPTLNNKLKISSESSEIFLNFHTECAFHPHMPDYLLLFCLRSDHDMKAATIFSCLSNFKNDIDDSLEQVLRKPLFKTGVDYSFGNTNTIQGNGRIIPIVSGDKNDSIIIFDPDLMQGITEEAKLALQKLETIVNKHKQEFILKPGEMLVIDNKRALHGRTFFKALFDGKDRWIQRLFVSRDLNAANVMFNKSERIISYKFE